MSKKKKSPEKVEVPVETAEVPAAEPVHVGVDPAIPETAPEVPSCEADLQKHPKFDKFKSHGGQN